MSFENLVVEKRNRIQYITINRESKLNTLSQATLNELHQSISEALFSADVCGIIITGAGSKAFAAGADISELPALDTAKAHEMATNAHNKVFNLLERSSKPVIAAINGFALGGGLELAMACHIRLAADSAKMGLPEVSLGLIPGYGGTQRLTRLVGKGRAMEMILSANMITAAEAETYGLVNHTLSQADLMPKAEELMNKILSNSTTAIASAIAAINAVHKPVNGFETEITLFANCFSSEDMREGVGAFLAKRKPNFTGN